MSASHDLERRLAAHFAAEAPSRAPDWVLADALETIDTTPQRRAPVRVPWRSPHMSMYARLAAAALAVVAVGAVGLSVMQPSPPAPGTVPATPNPTPSATLNASPEPSRPPALTRGEPYTSVINGISIGYPAGWSISPATRPWAGGEVPFFGEPPADFLYDPALTDHLFLSTVSTPLGDTPAEAWVADDAGLIECPSTEPVIVNGIAGTIGTECNQVLVAADGRGYAIFLHTSGDEGWLDQVYDRDWFLDVLDTVRFRSSSGAFRQPFSHSLPGGVMFDLGPDYGPTYYEVRIPAAAEAGSPAGITVQAIGGGRSDPCVATSAPVSIAAGPQAVLDYLGAIPELSVAGVTPTTVSFLPAVEATVAVEPTAECPELWPWAESPESMPDGLPVRLIAVDVGGEHVVLTVFGEAADPAWSRMADELIGSIRFASP